MIAPRFHHRRGAAFTLIELLVASSVLVIMLVIVVSITNQTTDVWRKSNARIEAFQAARNAFTSITQQLSQATLNTYWDYDNPNAPARYVRQSELHFIVDDAANLLPTGTYSGQAIFFQTPANRSATDYDGMTGLLNACGFWVEYGSNAAWLPAHVDAAAATERYRLFQWTEETESLAVYSPNAASQNAWIAPVRGQNALPVADNVVALFIWAREEQSSTPVLNQYRYNSRKQNPAGDQLPVEVNQLPPVVEIALVAIDEPSALRLGTSLKSEMEACFNGLFATDPATDFTQDFATLESRLAERQVAFRIFTSVVPLKEAKWSPQ